MEVSQGPSWVAFTTLLLLPAGSLLQTTEACRLGAGGPPASEKLPQGFHPSHSFVTLIPSTRVLRVNFATQTLGL